MRFVSTHPTQELNFNILGRDYKVPPGGEVEIDPAHVPYVISRGIMLEASAFKPKAAKPAPVETPKPSSK